jgi:hypothetical protein
MSKAAETHENVCPGLALEGEFASGSTTDQCMRVEERTAEPYTAGEGEGGMGSVMLLGHVTTHGLMTPDL